MEGGEKGKRRGGGGERGGRRKKGWEGGEEEKGEGRGRERREEGGRGGEVIRQVGHCVPLRLPSEPRLAGWSPIAPRPSVVPRPVQRLDLIRGSHPTSPSSASRWAQPGGDRRQES